MNDFLLLIGWNGPTDLGFDASSAVPDGALAMTAFLCVLGAVFLNRLTGLESVFNLILNFLAMVLFALLAQHYLGEIRLPVGSQMMTLALYCNLGMLAAGLLLGLYYTRVVGSTR